MRKIIRTLVLSVTMVLIISVSGVSTTRDPVVVKTIGPELSLTKTVTNKYLATAIKKETPHTKFAVIPLHIPEPKPEPITEEIKMSESDIGLIALVTMAEAEGEPELGKRLVIDTVLNRIDRSTYSSYIVHDVVYAKNQFTSMHTSRVKRCCIREDFVQLVREELAKRTNNEVYYFTAGNYGRYGRHLFRVGNHYFSAYKKIIRRVIYG